MDAPTTLSLTSAALGNVLLVATLALIGKVLEMVNAKGNAKPGG